MRTAGPVSKTPEAPPPQMLPQPMEDRQLLKRPLATAEPALSAAEAPPPPQMLPQPMEDQQLLKRRAA
jgi:hypothetical protein